MIHAAIASTGSALPGHEVRNEDLTQFPSATHRIIERKTGIQARRYASEGESTSTLGARAAEECLRKAGRSAEDIDAIFLATSSPDRVQPATATRVQEEIGARNAIAFDLNSVCTGAVVALDLAASAIRAGRHERVLVVGAEVYSRITNPDDFGTRPFFGDGAGAVLLEASTTPGFLAAAAHSDGSGADLIQVPAGGTLAPITGETPEKDRYFQMDGRAVYEFATRVGADVIREVADRAGVAVAEIRAFVLHQANVLILQEIARSLDIDPGRFPTTLERYGNTAAASVLITLDEVFDTFEPGDRVLLAAFGGGLSWGGILFELPHDRTTT